MRLDIISENKVRPLVQNPGIMRVEGAGERIGFNIAISTSKLSMIEEISTIPRRFSRVSTGSSEPRASLISLPVFIDKSRKRNTMETTY